MFRAVTYGRGFPVAFMSIIRGHFYWQRKKNRVKQASWLLIFPPNNNFIAFGTLDSW